MIESFNLGKYIMVLFLIFSFSTLRTWGQQAHSDAVSIKAWSLMSESPNHEFKQIISVDVQHKNAAPAKIDIYYLGKINMSDSVHQGLNHFEAQVPIVSAPLNSTMEVKVGNNMVFNKEIRLLPVKKRSIYLISHSHNDIGYSDYQENVETKQNENTRVAMELIAKTKNYPIGAKYKWNIESLWALENFFRVASELEKKSLIQDVKDGYIGLSAGYCNELTGVCRPQELYHLLDYSRWLHNQYGVDSKTYIISDVPGMNWSVVPEFAKRGVRYISDGPNYRARIGYTRAAWSDKPFYWVSASRKDTVLFWQAGEGYSYFLGTGLAGPKLKPRLMSYMHLLDSTNYPYDMIQTRYAVNGDNGTPDPQLSDYVKKWNAKYASPKLVIATVDEMMEKFEKKYGADLPIYSGDFTPYWEDGVMSTAREETIAKHAIERIIQAQVLHKMLTPTLNDSALFYQAWREAILWHEHTWGSSTAIKKPDGVFATRQWKYKQHFALAADSLSHILLSQWISSGKVASNHAYKVYNTSSWDRSGLVYLTKEQSTAGDGIVDEAGHPYPTQRLKNDSLVFMAKNVPALGERLFYNVAKKTSFPSQLKVSDQRLESQFAKVEINPATGAIANLIDKKSGRDFVDNTKGLGLNTYLYVPGLDPTTAEKTKDIQINIKENGPLIASLEITSKAPGTSELRQVIRIIQGQDQVDVINTFNKSKVRTKESVHFAYPVNVPDGKMRIDIGNAVMRPAINQLNGANKDFASVQRWVDISNNKYGLTVTTAESPLIEIGEMTNEVLDKQGNKVWKKKTTMSNTFYFYVMNNYWFTNYKADQEGWVTFHYSLFPHEKFNKTFSERKGFETGQPLLVTPMQ